MNKPTDKRFEYANKEAILSLILTLLYLCFWVGCSYYLSTDIGFLGFPLWFEAGCILTPIAFVIVCIWVVKIKFKNIPLDAPQDTNNN